MFLSRTAFSWRRALGGLAIASAALLTAAGSSSAHSPLFGFFAPRSGYDPEDYIRNSAVVPAYYGTVSKFDRANAGAYGWYAPRPWTPCSDTPPEAIIAPPRPDAVGMAPK